MESDPSFDLEPCVNEQCKALLQCLGIPLSKHFKLKNFMSGSLMPITDEMKIIFKDRYKGTIDSIQLILTSLKEKGYSQAQAVRLIMAEMKLFLVDADKIVMNAIAWSGDMEGNEIFRENFIEALLSGNSKSEVDGAGYNYYIKRNDGV